MVQKLDSEDWSWDGGGTGGAESIGQPYGNVALPVLPAELTAIVETQVINNTPIADSAYITTPIEPIPSIIPPIVEDTIQTTEREYLTLQVAKEGFGSYLDGILPEELAIAAGAFSASMQNIKNILNVDFEKFAQVAFAMETVKGLDLVNGTDVPADVALANQGYLLTALGTGPNGTYTMSDLFGCMSGLPYPWKGLYDGILELQTSKLKTIYDQLYLGVTWEQATATVSYSYEAHQIGDTGPPDYTPIYEWRYRINSVTLTDSGGGYGRSAASTPTGAFSGNGYYSTEGGATVSYSIGTDNSNFTTYGRVIDFSSSAGTWVVYNASTTNATAPDPQIVYQIQAPPTAYTSYPYTGGTNTAYGTAGWPTAMNTTLYVNPVTPALIKDANDEIAVIRTTRPIKANNLNTLHNLTGSQLSFEQRARFNGIPPVPQGTRDRFLNLYPSALMVFVDSLPELAKNTLPHMQVQTLEAISNLDLTPGQSVVAAMRESRNAARLDMIGANQDNVIPAEIAPEQELALILNGTTATTVPNNTLSDPPIYTYPRVPSSPTSVGYTRPSYPNQSRNNVPIVPTPFGYFNGTNVMLTPNISPGDPNTLVPLVDGTNVSASIPNIPRSPTNAPGSPTNAPGSPTNAPVPLDTKLGRGSALIGPGPNLLNKLAPIAGPSENAPVVYPTVGTTIPTGPAVPLDVGKAPLGSFAPSKAVNLLPPNLKFAAGVTLPSTFNVPEAIEEVIKCNCDCWVQ